MEGLLSTGPISSSFFRGRHAFSRSHECNELVLKQVITPSILYYLQVIKLWNIDLWCELFSGIVMNVRLNPPSQQLQCAVCSVQCALCSFQCAVWSVQ